jgi:uncharacterized protein YceK
MTILALSIFALSFLTGCIGIMDRTEYKTPIYRLYQPTCECAEGISIPFEERGSVEKRIAQAVCTVFLPVLVIDLPFEAVFDTLLMPWDAYLISKKEKMNHK